MEQWSDVGISYVFLGETWELLLQFHNLRSCSDVQDVWQYVIEKDVPSDL